MFIFIVQTLLYLRRLDSRSFLSQFWNVIKLVKIYHFFSKMSTHFVSWNELHAVLITTHIKRHFPSFFQSKNTIFIPQVHLISLTDVKNLLIHLPFRIVWNSWFFCFCWTVCFYTFDEIGSLIFYLFFKGWQ